MDSTPPYTAREQTPEQRRQLIDKGRAWSVAQGATPGPAAEALYARYVAGEITLQGITEALRAQDERRVVVERTPTASSSVPCAAEQSAGRPRPLMQPESLLLT